MFEQAFRNIDDVLRKEAGCTTELDYTEQTSWLLFLKYLDGLEQDRADEAALSGKKYGFMLDKPYRWESWAAPKDKDGKLDHNRAQTGDDLHDFVDKKLFPSNPPFGGQERKEVQQNFPIRTGETAFLFLQHFIRMLKAPGRGAVVIKNTFLSNTDNASVSLCKHLLESCNLHTVLDCPGGTFQGAGVKTVVLFFDKGSATRKTWFYQLDPGRNLGKTNPLNDDDLAEFVKLQRARPTRPRAGPSTPRPSTRPPSTCR
jgi:hypothetical protein